MSRKKIVLFFVEGITEKTCLGLVLSRILTRHNVQFQITHGDITTKNEATPATINKLLGNTIRKFLSPVFKASDIKKVVHLVDMDGAYISEEAIKESDNIEATIHYNNDFIYAKNVVSILARNEKKQQILNKLCTMRKTFRNIPYSVYFFFCNLDHVLHNENNLSNKEKTTRAEAFEDRYAEDLEGFLAFLKTPSFAVKGNYAESWNFIKLDTNSLKRYSNFHLYPELKL